MPEMSYERINDYATISISLASPNDIRSWSHGEVKTPETINYRTYRPEKDGLFCERIFGPERDWECNCGKFKGIKYKDIICDRCGVKITHSKVRRSRMGHINLAVPVVHIWFFRAMPSRLGTLLGIKSTGLQQIIYFQRYAVLNAGTPPAVLPANLECRKCQACPIRDECDKASCARQESFSSCAECKACAKAAQTKILKPRDLLNEEEHKFVTRCSHRCQRKDFVAEMGAESVRAMLRDLNLAKEEEELRAELRRRRKSTFSAVKYFIDKGLLKDKDDGKWEEPDTEEELRRFAAAHLQGKPEAIDAAVTHIAQEGMAEPTRVKTETLVKRLRLIQALRSRSRLQDSERDPMWMVMDVVPVIPPDLRPLVPLDSGNFATSDLNDLYRRVIYRNNRLARLLDLNAPSVIVRNEKRMLQQAVDALFDNGRCKRPVQGAGNRPLKSLTDMIKGKQGRFRANLLGKRVDYSARSVIIVGPELRIDQVGLPKKIALELFQPFIIRALKERGLADTIKSAKTMLERKDSEIWDVLEKVIEGHPVMLNRAPTLHRMGIQAFYPVLVEGDAIRIHPLVCSGFNADFDGDQMAVHLPLTVEAQTEASLLMISAANIFSPAHGNPVITADLDIVLGGYYLTLMRSGIPGGWVYSDVDDAMAAYEGGQLHLCAPIAVRVPADWRHIRMRPQGSGAKGMAAGDDTVLDRVAAADGAKTKLLASNEDELKLFLRGREARRGGKAKLGPLPPVDATGVDWNADGREDGARPYIVTTIGRLLFKELLPMKDVLYNYPMNKRSLNRVVSDCHVHGRSATVGFLDDMKEAGFHYATLSGLSFATCDLRTPGTKPAIIAEAEKRVALIQDAHMGGDITEGERYNQIVDAWTHVSEAILKDLLEELRGRGDEDQAAALNPIWAMFDSGARGSTTQIRQLAGFRGLMSKPNGRIIETPIRANFREGLRGLEYFSSTHGARKGLADTALKTADSGYLTRKLVEVAQDVTITALDCGTERGVAKGAVMSGEHEEVSLADNIVGRVACDNIVNIYTGEKVVQKGELITREIAQAIQALDYGKIRIRSPLTCDMPFGLCMKCYGMDLSTGRLVEPGTAVGVIAAQSIGEPGTQLTMRTFHIGGIAKHAVTESELRADVGGVVKFQNLRVVETRRRNEQGADVKVQVVLNRNGEMIVTDERGREIGESIPVPAGAILRVKEGDAVKARHPLAVWDAYNTPLLTEKAGTVRFEDIIEGKTMRIETDASGFERKIIAEHRGEQQPQISIIGRDGHIIAFYSVPEKAHLRVEEGDEVIAGQELARTPREVGTTQDITGGLPRVTELFEARRPKDPAVMAEVGGVVALGERRRGKRQILIETETGQTVEHLVPQGKHIRVQNGDRVRAGEPLVEGPLVPHDILAVNGVEALQNYLLNEIQKVYRSQNVRINDKHIEIIVRQMLAKVKIEDSGDTPFLLTDSVSLSTIRRVNEEMLAKAMKPARYVPILQGVARASLSSESVIAAASFQETTRVLTDGALAGRRDTLRGLKENVLIGRMIPAGTGYSTLRKAQVRTAAPAVAPNEGLAVEGLPDSDLEKVLEGPPPSTPTV